MQYTLTISGGHAWAGRSARSTTHPSEEEAYASLLQYVKANWDEVGCDLDEETEDDELIGEYFRSAPETWVIAAVLPARSTTHPGRIR